MTDLTPVAELAASADHLGVIAVATPGGAVHASLVKAGVLDDPADGAPSVGIVVAGSARKLDHLRQSGRGAVVFSSGYRWVAVEGPVRLEGPDDPPPPGADRSISSVLRDVFRAAGGTHDDWEAFDRVMAEDRRCAVFVKPATVTGVG